MLEVDGLRLRAQQVDFAARVIVALFEGLEGGCRLPFEAEGGGDFGPVEFQGDGALGISVSRVLRKPGTGREMLVAARTPAAMSAISMAMGLCWRKVSLWEIDVEVLLGSWQASSHLVSHVTCGRPNGDYHFIRSRLRLQLQYLRGALQSTSFGDIWL